MPRPSPLSLSISSQPLTATDADEAYQSPQTTPSSVASSGDRVMSAPLSPLEDENTKYRLPDEVSGPPKVMHFIRDLASNRGEHRRMMSAESQPSSQQGPSPSTPPSPSVIRSPTKRSTTTADQTDLPETSPTTTHLNRHGSVCTLTRPALSVQLAKLTAQLDEATTFSTSISSSSSLSNASEAAKRLTEIGEQAQGWIRRTSEAARGLDAEDDVQWCLGGGRDGISSVDRAVDSFEGVISLYVLAIEEIQLRNDIADVPAEELKVVVDQMESTVGEWKRLRAALKRVKEQIELAMEWEELSNVVFQDISVEIDDLNRFIFETEERRHKILIAEMRAPPGNGRPGSSELESIMEKTSSVTQHSPSSPLLSPTSAETREDSSLVALVARMQPLRASLDFLPMRLSSFHLRAQAHFPTACLELQSRRKGLESRWAELESDAQSLRRELTEDRYVFVFRNAAGQAQKMCQSLSRSLSKLQEAIRSSADHHNPPSFAMKVENYEAKKTHYGPSIERVLAIIGRGINDRLTANGEILRLQSEVEGQWRSIQDQMRKMDLEILKMNLRKHQPRLSMSMSSAISMERPNSSTTVDTTTRETSPSSSFAAADRNLQLPKRGTTPSLLPRPTVTPRRDCSSRCPSSVAMRPPSSGRVTPSMLPRPIFATERSVTGSRRSSSSIWPSARSTSAAVESPLSNLIARPKWRAASSSVVPRPMSVASTSRDTFRRRSTTAWPSSPSLSATGPKQRWRPSPSLLPQLPQPISPTSNSRDSSRRSSLAAVWPSTPSSTIAVDSPSSVTGMPVHIPSTGTKSRWSLPVSKLPRPASRQQRSVTQTPVGSKKPSAAKLEKPRWRH